MVGWWESIYQAAYFFLALAVLLSSITVCITGDDLDFHLYSRLVSSLQLVEHQSAVPEVEGSSPIPDQHSGS